MGICACIDKNNLSPSNPGNTAVVDVSSHTDKIIKIQNTQQPSKEEPILVEKNHVKQVINITSKNKTNSTQCSNLNRDTFVNELKFNKNNEMVKEGNNNKEIVPPIGKEIPQKVKYKSNKEQTDFNNVNIVIFGDKHTGKSAFVIKYVDNFFEKLYIPSISIERHFKKVAFGRMEIKFTFLITPGDPGYQIDYESVLTGADFIFIFYDTSVNGGFDVAKRYCVTELSSYHKEYSNIARNVIFIGNKIDIVPRKEPKAKIEKFCTENMFKYFEVSAKSAAGIKDIMQYIALTHFKLIELRGK